MLSYIVDSLAASLESIPSFQDILVSFEDECSQGGDNVTPCNQNRRKISFSKKSAGATNGGIDGP